MRVVMQIKLATGSVSVLGAFEASDTIQDVYEFTAAVTPYVRYAICSHALGSRQAFAR